jgi:uncharacterized protein YfaS (alpha-2-macroglobulin family)
VRLTNDEGTEKIDRGDYQDIRDDRVYTYFMLWPNRQRSFRVSLTASYSGTFYLPGVYCEGMYDNTITAKEKGQVVEVVKRVVQ